MIPTTNVSDFNITSNSKIKTFNSENIRICNLDCCTNKFHSKGLCSKHYRQYLKHGRLTPELEIKEKLTNCKIPSCENKGIIVKGLCRKHYTQMETHGRLRPDSEKEYHGLKNTVEYQLWCNIKERCFNKNGKSYKFYGGRGITMSNEFENSFKAFYNHIGKRPSKNLSIDRIDNNKNYERGNLRWATKSKQAINRRKRRTNKSGTTGVHWHKQSERWRSYISVNKVSKYLGSFNNIEEAINTRKKAELKYWGALISE